MQRLLIAATLTAAATARPAAAVEGTWCLRASVGVGTVTEIKFPEAFKPGEMNAASGGRARPAPGTHATWPIGKAASARGSRPGKFTRKSKSSGISPASG